MKIPDGPDALSAAWLTAALRNWMGDGNVASFKVMALAESKGFYGQLVRLRLKYTGDAPGAPRSLIAKFSSANAEMRKRSVDSYEREVRFYQQLANSTELPTAFCYYANINTETGDHVLLLQDLAAMQSGSRVAGCSVEQARVAIKQIAKLHIRWWGRTGDAALAWLADGDVEVDAEALRRQYEQWWPQFYSQVEGKLPGPLQHLSHELGSQRAKLRRHIFGSSPRTLIHRDYQLDNLFFGGSAPTFDFAVIDWQFLSRGRGVWDVAYFLSENLLPDDRRGVEMELLASYQQSLADSSIRDYSFEQCLADYRLALLQRHTALVSTIAAMPFSAEQRRLHIDILLPRNIATILDHDAFAVL